MAEYITTSDANVALYGTIPFGTVSIPCNTGNVIPLAVGVLNLKGNNRYNVKVKANVQIPTGGAVTPVAIGITVNGSIIPESVAIITPAAVEEYEFINTDAVITVPCGCCASVSAVYVDGTEDDPATTPTPSIGIRRNASITITGIS